MFRMYFIATALLLAASGSTLILAQGRVTARTNSVATELTDDEVLLLYGFGSGGKTSKAAENAVRDFLSEREAVSKFLKRRRVVATDEAIDRRLDDVRRVLAAKKLTLDQALKQSGIDEETLKRALAVPVAWNEYLRVRLTEDAIKKEFESGRSHYDGTQVRIVQIFFPAKGQPIASSGPSGNGGSVSHEAATRLRERIESGSLGFEDALNETDGEKANDPVWIRYRGDVPNAVADWTFDADVGDVSPALSSPFGSHIVKVLDSKMGDRSLEDARRLVIRALSDRLWAEAVLEGARR